MTSTVDIAIVGAGMVGSCLALMLAQKTDLNIALIEHRLPEKLSPTAPPAIRVSALNLASQHLLEDIGLWPQLWTERLGPFESMQVWDADAEIYFDAAELGTAVLGHIIENQHLQQIALEAVRIHPKIRFLAPVELVKREQQTLHFADHSAISAKLIIAADGGHSPLREAAGIQTRGWQYDQQGLVCTIETEHPHEQSARQRFLEGGPLAFLPLADPHRCSIVWSLPSSEAKAMTELDAQIFCEKLAEAFDFQAGTITLLSERKCFPLQLRHANDYVQTGFALVGDAAHTIHPLAGQGVNLGLQDAAALANIISISAEQGRDIGHLHTLKKYQRQRLAENLAMQFTMEGLHRLFGSDLSTVKWLRRTGIKQLNQLDPIKHQLMRYAAGRV